MRMWKRHRTILLSVLAVAVTVPRSSAEEYLDTEESVHSHQTVMDAWFNGKAEVYVSDGLFAKFAGDLRQELADDGIIAYGWSMTALQGNPTGGLDQDSQYTNLTDFGLDFDWGI